MCLTTRGVVLFKSRDVRVVQDARGVCNTEGKANGGVDGMKGYIYLRSCNSLVQLVGYDNFDSYPAFCWLMNT